MNQSLQKSLLHLTGGEDIDAVSLGKLEKLTDQYPFFTVAQVLLAKKLKAANDERFLSQVQKTALYFNNPYWLHYQLLSEQPGIVITTKEQEQHKPEAIKEEIAEDTATAESAKNAVLHNVSPTELEKASRLAKDTLAFKRHEAESAAETYVKPEVIPVETAEEETTPVPDQFHPEPEFIQEELVEEEAVDTQKSAAGENVKVDLSSEEAPGEKKVELREDNGEDLRETTPDEKDPENVVGKSEDDNGSSEERSTEETSRHLSVSEDGLVTNDSLSREAAVEEVYETKSGEEPQLIGSPTEENENIGDDTREPGTDEIPKAVSVSEEELAEDETLLNEIAHHSEAPKDDVVVEKKAEVSEDDLLPDDDKITISLDDHDVFSKGDKGEKNQTLSSGFGGFKSDTNELIPIEPYHTIDYFASQGIKLELEKNPKDKLGKNLRSFTDWLKHMKKLGPEDAIDTVRSDHQESIIQGIADSSNIQRDIVTETMAEVLAKQGKKEKAIQLYIKLSFLNPDKSAYFADKIQKLKGI